MDLDSSNVETSQSIIPHSEGQGPRLTDSDLGNAMRLKFFGNSVRMVAYSQLLGESSTLIRIALKESDLKVIQIIVNV